MAGNKFVTIDLANGRQKEVRANQTSAGVADAGKVVAIGAAGVLDDSILGAATTGTSVVLKTDSNGKIDVNVLPVGVGPDVATITCSEDLAAGDFVNVHDVTGAFRVRKADASNGREANGYVTNNYLSGNAATVYFEGPNPHAASLTPGVVFLSATVPGEATSSVPTAGAGVILQRLGFATSATSVNVEIEDPTELVA